MVREPAMLIGLVYQLRLADIDAELMQNHLLRNHRAGEVRGLVNPIPGVVPWCSNDGAVPAVVKEAAFSKTFEKAWDAVVQRRVIVMTRMATIVMAWVHHNSASVAVARPA
jgi:hypothetical protein